MPKKTVITPLVRPTGFPGGVTSFRFAAIGIDGVAKGFADVSYPVLPGNEFGAVYGPNMTTEIGPFSDGETNIIVKIPPNDHPLPAAGVQAELRLRLFELDGMEWDGGIYGPFPVDIVAAQAQSPVQPQPAPTPASVDLPAEYDLMFAKAGDIVNAANIVGDAELAEVGLNIQRTIDKRKARKR